MVVMSNLLAVQLVIVVERMGSHDQVTETRIGWQGDRQRWWLLTLRAPALQRQADRIGMGHRPRERLIDGRLQLAGAVAVEETRQGRRDGAEVFPAFGRLHQQRTTVGDGLGQAILSAMLARFALALDQRGQMRGILDLLAGIIVARMRGDHDRPIEGSLGFPVALYAC